MKIKRFSILGDALGGGGAVKKMQHEKYGLGKEEEQSKEFSDIPMTFEVKEIGIDSGGRFAIVQAKNDITGEIVEKKMYEKKVYDSEKDFSENTAENVSASLGASGLAAGIGYVGSKVAEDANKSSENIADKLRWKRSTGKKGELVLEDRGQRRGKLANKIEKAGETISKFAKKKSGKAAIIATPTIIAGGTTYYAIGRRKKKKHD